MKTKWEPVFPINSLLLSADLCEGKDEGILMFKESGRVFNFFNDPWTSEGTVSIPEWMQPFSLASSNLQILDKELKYSPKLTVGFLNTMPLPCMPPFHRENFDEIHSQLNELVCYLGRIFKVRFYAADIFLKVINIEMNGCFLIGPNTEIIFEMPKFQTLPEKAIQKYIPLSENNLLQIKFFISLKQQDSMIITNFRAPTLLFVDYGQSIFGDDVDGGEEDFWQDAKNLFTGWLHSTARINTDTKIVYLPFLELLSDQCIVMILDCCRDSDKSLLFKIPIIKQNQKEKITKHLNEFEYLLIDEHFSEFDENDQRMTRFLTSLRSHTNKESLIEDEVEMQRLDRIGAHIVKSDGVDWDSIVGYEDVKENVQILLTTIKNSLLTTPIKSGNGNLQRLSSRSQRLGINCPNGILFHGPSGCGKSLIVKALASEGIFPMIEMLSSQILSPYLGETEEKIRDLFAKCRQNSPCFLLIDNIERFGGRRGLGGDQGDGHNKSNHLSTLLNEMDGVCGNKDQRVIVIACTQNKDLIDDALLRPGRLDVHIEVPFPTKKAKTLLCEKFQISDYDFLNEEGDDAISCAELLKMKKLE